MTELKSIRPAYPRAVRIWLVIGLILVLGQIVIGGITRLTESGLSITKWEIVAGTLPPLTTAKWQEAFDLYKDTPQYAKINEGMSLSDFKFIYFWEYLHRLWARSMGFVFLIPFLIFWRKGWIDRPLMRDLGIVVLLAALAASFGWVMVASGLINRPWVNAYKLTIHLSIACLTYSYLLWTTFKVFRVKSITYPQSMWKTTAYWLTAVAIVQIILGGIMSGAKAALAYPTWPDMHGKAIPEALLNGANWTVENFVHYDTNLFFPALVQLCHRSTAYVLTIMVLYFAYKVLRQGSNRLFTSSIYLLVTLLVIQVGLGIFTLLSSIGYVPVGMGVLHQLFAIFLFSAILFIDYQLFARKN